MGINTEQTKTIQIPEVTRRRIVDIHTYLPVLIDIIKSGKGQTAKLQQYLDSFISNVSVQELARNFIKQMRHHCVYGSTLCLR